MFCEQCRYYKASEMQHESNDICLNKKAKLERGGIRSESYITHARCASMLESHCENHKLFEPKLEVA